MTFEHFQNAVEERWEAVRTQTDSDLIVPSWIDWYRSLSNEEHVLADRLLSEWASSSEDGKQFVALALIQTFGIVEALHSVQALSERLKPATDAESRFLRRKVLRVIDAITNSHASE